ncbi:MAG TPA: DUF3592 domain-containing protein [Fimbriimonadaceae bacterium]|nr:DUF3592 domain-containing protein [Fimbriimonadaceae bacterium]
MRKPQLIAIAIFLAIGGLLPLVGSVSQHKTEDILASRGVHVHGIVQVAGIETDTDSDGSSSRSYYLEVSYHPSNYTTRQKFYVTRSAYESHPFHSVVEVIFDPVDPRVAILGGDLNNSTSTKSLIIGLALWAASIAAGIWALLMHRSEAVFELDEAVARAKRGQ